MPNSLHHYPGINIDMSSMYKYIFYQIINSVILM